MKYLQWKAEQAHDTLVKGGARRCDADEIYQLILDGNSFEDAICNYALGWLRDEMSDIWVNIQNDHSVGESLSSELVFFMVAFVADEEIEKMRAEIAKDHEWVDDLVWHRLFEANTWVSYDDHVLKLLVYIKSDFNSWHEWRFLVPFKELKTFPKRAERDGLDIDEWLRKTYKEVKDFNPEDRESLEKLASTDVGNEWTSHFLGLYRPK